MKGNSLASNAVFNILYKLFNALFPMISTMYVARVLLPSDIGNVGFAQNIVQYFVLVAVLGIPSYGSRELAKHKNDNITPAISQLYSELFILNFLSTSICIGIYVLFILCFPALQQDIILYSVVGLPLYANLFNVEWFYIGKRNFRFIALRNIAVKCIAIVLLLLLVKKPADYVKYALVYASASAANHLVNFLHLRKYNICFSLDLHICQHLKPVIILLATSITIELYTLLDVTMVGIICNKSAVAYYTYSIQIVRVVIIIVTAIGGILLPRLSYYISCEKKDMCQYEVNKVLNIILVFLVPAGAGLLLTADELIYILYGQNFADAVNTLCIASLLTITLGFSNLFGSQILIAFNDERKIFYATLAGALSNIIMNLMLIPVLQQNGAALASVLSEGLVTLISYKYARKYLKIIPKASNVKCTFFSTIVMSLVLLLIKYFIINILLRFIICVLAGVCLYVGLNFLLKNQVIIEVFRWGKKSINPH